MEGFLPPKLPLRAGEGPLQGTVGGRLKAPRLALPGGPAGPVDAIPPILL